MMIDINPYHLEIVTQILTEHVPDCEVRAFGSRATWTSKDYSDLDLAIVGDEPLRWRTLGKLRDAFEESYLPMRVDVLDWHDISDKFREMIREDCVVIYKNGSINDWKKLTLRQCIEMEVSNYSEKEAWSFINYLDTGNITTNTIKEVQHLVAGRDKIPTRARRKIKPGDIVYSMVRPNQRHFGLIKHPPENFLVSTGFAVLRGKPGVAHTDFIYYLLTQEHIVDYLQAIAENSTSAYPSIRPHDLEQLEIRLPSLPKQRDIAHILSTLDEKIELNRRMNETLEAMAQALFKSWFVDFNPVRAKIEGRWRPGESLPGLPAHLYDLFSDRLIPSELGEIPEGWEITTIDKKVTVVGGSTPSTKEPSYWDGSINWVTPKDLSNLNSPVLLETDKKITNAGLKKISSGLLPSGTVLLSSRAPIGYTAITEIPVAINQGFIAMKCEHLASLYVWLWTVTNHESILTVANGSTFQEVNKRSFRTLLLCIPPTSVRKNFQYVAEDLYKLIVKNEREIRILRGLHRSLLPTVISN